jgi:hypothetical protein
MCRRRFPLRLALAALSSALSLSIAGSAAAQTTPSQYLVTGNLSGLSSSTSDILQAKITLVNCGAANPVVPGVTNLVAKTLTLTANSGGNISGSLWGNDEISCNGFSSTLYQVQFLRSGIPTGIPTLYRIVAGDALPSGFNLTTASPVTVLPPTANLENGFHCLAGEAVVGVLADLTPVCLNLGNTVIALNDGTLQLYTSAVLASPEAGQSVAQPAGTTLAVNSLNSVLYVNPALTTDLVTQVNALAASCSGSCTIHIPANPSGCYTVTSGTIYLHQHGISLVGDGKNNTCINYAGTNFLDLRYSGADYDSSYSQGAEITGFTLNATNAAVKAMTIGSVQNLNFHDITLVGPAGIVNAGSAGTSQAFIFQNTYNWMERTSFHNITIGGFLYNKHWMAATGSGTDSYAYGVWDGLHENVGPGGASVLVDAGAGVYHTLKYEGSVNSTNTSSSDSLFQINGTFSGTNFHFDGEGSFVNFANVTSTGQMFFDGGISTFEGNSNIGTGIFCIGPSCTSTPLLAGYNAAGTIANYGGTSQTATVYPVETLAGTLNYAPAEIAGRSYVVGSIPNGLGALPTSMMFVHDSALPLCISVLTGASYSQSPAASTPEQCFNGTVISSPEAQIGDVTIGPLDVMIDSGSADTPNLTQQSDSTFGLYSEVDTTQGSWWWGVESNFQPNPGFWYFGPKSASPSAIPPLQISPSGGIIAPSFSAGSQAGITGTVTITSTTTCTLTITGGIITAKSGC